MAQYNPRRATQRRKPEIMTSVANQPFDDKKFNFSKINDTKELLFSLQFEEDTEEVLLIFNIQHSLTIIYIVLK